MAGRGWLLAFPVESVVLRVALALALGLLIVRAVGPRRLRSPRARVALAAAPFAAAGLVVLLSSADPRPPAILRPTTQGGALALPIADRYFDFAPAAPWLVAAWALATCVLVALRITRATAARSRLLAGTRAAPPRVASAVGRLARALGVTPPRALVAPAVGGAALVGVRRPVLVLDERLLTLLDDAELEGVVAHELAHLSRHDNLLAWLAALVRDAACFVPGASWALRALHREREFAADQTAVAVTCRPGALASGLLRAVELGGGPRRIPLGCAALVERDALVARVQVLVEPPAPAPRRDRAELMLASGVGLLALAVALGLPARLTADGQRDALAVLFGPPAAQVAAGTPAVVPGSDEGRVFEVFRRVAPVATGGIARNVDVRIPDLLGADDRAGVARACATDAATCPTAVRAPALGIRPGPIVLSDPIATARWQATPVREVAAGDTFLVYWLARLEGRPAIR